MLIGGGFTADEALEMAADAAGDGDTRASVDAVRRSLESGTTFPEALEKARLFDPVYTGMIRMGVLTGREADVLEKIAALAEEDAEEEIARLTGTIEPTLVAVLSVIIGAVLLSVILPMAGLLTGIA